MPSMNRQQRRYNLTPQRRKIPGVGAEATRPRRTPILVNSFSHSTITGTVTFNQAVVLSGIPNWPDNSGHLPISAVMASPTVMTVVYDGSIATPVTIPFEDPAIRNNAGGFVRPGSQVVT